MFLDLLNETDDIEILDAVRILDTVKPEDILKWKIFNYLSVCASECIPCQKLQKDFEIYLKIVLVLYV